MFTRRHKKNILRFRQWRRKSYAAFHSIGKHVTIGKIKNIVADTLLGKQKTIDGRSSYFTLYSLENAFEEIDDPLIEEQLLLQTIPACLQQKSYCKGYKSLLPFLQQKAECEHCFAFSHFFYLKKTSK